MNHLLLSFYMIFACHASTDTHFHAPLGQLHFSPLSEMMTLLYTQSHLIWMHTQTCACHIYNKHVPLWNFCSVVYVSYLWSTSLVFWQLFILCHSHECIWTETIQYKVWIELKLWTQVPSLWLNRLPQSGIRLVEGLAPKLGAYQKSKPTWKTLSETSRWGRWCVPLVCPIQHCCLLNPLFTFCSDPMGSWFLVNFPEIGSSIVWTLFFHGALIYNSLARHSMQAYMEINEEQIIRM